MDVQWICICVLLCTMCIGCYGNSLPHSDSRKIFSMYDKNHDRCISETEFTSIFLDFDTWPEDQQISRTELLNGWVTDHLHDTQDVPFFFEILDHETRDNEITVHEMTSLYKSVFDNHGTGCVSSSRFDYVWSSLFYTV